MCSRRLVQHANSGGSTDCDIIANDIAPDLVYGNDLVMSLLKKEDGRLHFRFLQYSLLQAFSRLAQSS